jgi:hypothetical protein
LKIRYAATLAAILLLACIAPSGARPSTAPGPGNPSAVIVNSGSTNIPGYRIEIWRTGKVVYTVMRRSSQHVGIPGDTPIPAGPQTLATRPALAKRFFADLAAAAPLSSYPPVHCMKSASFGYRLTVQYKDQVSPDLSCPENDPKIRKIAADVDSVTKAVQSASMSSN